MTIPMEEQFDVFLSHNSRNKPTVRQLAEALQQRGLKVWLDEWELVPGRLWQEALEEIIRTTRSAAVLVGKDGLGPWEIPEMRGCLSEFVSRKLPVIPVLLPDAPSEPNLPLFLKGLTWVDLRAGSLNDDNLDRLE
jgi:nucleotide-binding universal stress UspA family protein